MPRDYTIYTARYTRGDRQIRTPRVVKLLAGLAVLAVATPPIYSFPSLGLLYTALGAIYLALLLLMPSLWLLVLPVATVLVDSATWTGRAAFNEFDWLVLLTVASGLLYNRFRLKVFKPSPAVVLLGLLLAFIALGYSGWLFLLLPPGRAWDNLDYTPAHAYVLVKGILWGIALVPMWSHLLATDKQRAVTTLVAGMILAALCLGLVVLWDRLAFGGLLAASWWQRGINALLDFSPTYRATGLFSDMRIGTEAAGGVLLLLLPATLYAMTYGKSRALRLAGSAGFIALAYSSLARSSVAVSAALALGVVLYGLYTRALRRRSGLPQALPRSLQVAALVALVLAAYPIVRHLDTSDTRQQSRAADWHQVTASSAGGFWHQLAGNGIGMFPLSYRKAHPEQAAAAGGYAVARDEAFNVLLLGGARSFSVGQRVGIEPRTTYGVYLRLRAREAAALTVSLCERNLLYPDTIAPRCVRQDVDVAADYGQFHEVSLALDSRGVGQGRAVGRWPLVFSLQADTAGVIEIHTVKLTDDDRQLLRNSSFADGLDYWLAYPDAATTPRHIDNLFQRLWFETGWLGLGLFLLLLGLVLRSTFDARAVDSLHPVYTTGVAAVCLLGVGASPLDSPRVAWLFYFFLLAGIAELKSTGRARPRVS